MATSHDELVAEMTVLEQLPAQERLKLAHKRRMQQIKFWLEQEENEDVSFNDANNSKIANLKTDMTEVEKSISDAQTPSYNNANSTIKTQKAPGKNIFNLNNSNSGNWKGNDKKITVQGNDMAKTMAEVRNETHGYNYEISYENPIKCNNISTSNGYFDMENRNGMTPNGNNDNKKALTQSKLLNLHAGLIPDIKNANSNINSKTANINSNSSYENKNKAYNIDMNSGKYSLHENGKNIEYENGEEVLSLSDNNESIINESEIEEIASDNSTTEKSNVFSDKFSAKKNSAKTFSNNQNGNNYFYYDNNVENDLNQEGQRIQNSEYPITQTLNHSNKNLETNQSYISSDTNGNNKNKQQTTHQQKMVKNVFENYPDIIKSVTKNNNNKNSKNAKNRSSKFDSETQNYSTDLHDHNLQENSLSCSPNFANNSNSNANIAGNNNYKKNSKANQSLSGSSSKNGRKKGKRLQVTKETYHKSTLPPTALKSVKFHAGIVLLEAASRNDLNEVRQLLENGIDPNVANADGLTALHQCCIDNYVEMVELLLDYGADINSADTEKWTPLHAAATCGHANLIKLFSERGANLLALNADGNMPYDMCEDEHALDVLETQMSEQGITQDDIDEARMIPERHMLNELKARYKTLLMLVSESTNNKTKLFNVTNNNEKNNCNSNNNNNILAKLNAKDRKGITPLHIASANGYVSVVEFLLNPNIIDANNKNNEKINKNKIESKNNFENKIEVNCRDCDGWTPMHAAAFWGHPNIIELLISKGAEIEPKNNDGETPIDICEDPDIKDRLLDIKTELEQSKSSQKNYLWSHANYSRASYRRNSSIRRSSIRDKTALSKREILEEAKLRLENTENDIDENSTSPTIPNSTISMASNANYTQDYPKKGSKTPEILLNSSSSNFETKSIMKNNGGISNNYTLENNTNFESPAQNYPPGTTSILSSTSISPTTHLLPELKKIRAQTRQNQLSTTTLFNNYFPHIDDKNDKNVMEYSQESTELATPLPTYTQATTNNSSHKDFSDNNLPLKEAVNKNENPKLNKNAKMSTNLALSARSHKPGAVLNSNEIAKRNNTFNNSNVPQTRLENNFEDFELNTAMGDTFKINESNSSKTKRKNQTKSEKNSSRNANDFENGENISNERDQSSEYDDTDDENMNEPKTDDGTKNKKSKNAEINTTSNSTLFKCCSIQ